MIHTWIKGDPENRKKSLRRWSLANRYLVVPLYRVGLLPLLGFGGTFLLLYTVGRRSGRQRITPLEYRRMEDAIYIVSGRGRRADWYRNMRANPSEVVVRVGFRRLKPEITLIEDDADKEGFLTWYVTEFPQAASLLFGWDKAIDNIHNVDYSDLVKLLEIIKLETIN